MLKHLRRIHNDERGLETLQVIMVIAIAAVILAFVKTQWTSIKSWVTTALDAITQFTTA